MLTNTDNMGSHVTDQITRLMTQRRIHIVDSKVLILGLTFKENCPDLRNTKIADITQESEALNAKVDIYDSWVDKAEARHEYALSPIDTPEQGTYDAIILAVAHDELQMGIETIRALGKENHVLFDVKCLFSPNETDGRL